jgi:hemolysin activation/secretion protein
MSQGLGGDMLGAITLSAGTSAGDLPPQRRWFLGGARTIRGQRPDTAFSGEAYWMTQGEMARDLRGMRGIVFGDVGWTGARRALGRHEFGRPLSSVGVGTSFLDGLIRLDVARGISPRREWRVTTYIEARM